jgi:crotonobetainyl-CoA:carnitine CoA-transferase CaiB-like acyl-CoA transferase
VTLEKRHGNLYYYRSVRQGETVRKVYMGSGELARIAHEREMMSLAAEEHQRQEELEEREKLEGLAAPVLELSEAAEILTRAHLIASGFRRHKGEWRRARNT